MSRGTIAVALSFKIIGKAKNTIFGVVLMLRSHWILYQESPLDVQDASLFLKKTIGWNENWMKKLEEVGIKAFQLYSIIPICFLIFL